MEVLIRGAFEKRRFLDLLRYFVVFEDDGGGAQAKKMASYHQFQAVNVAVAETLRAAQPASAAALAETSGRYEAGRQPGGEGAGLLVSRKLAALHDTLLPKLISGELWLKDAERIIGMRE